MRYHEHIKCPGFPCHIVIPILPGMAKALGLGQALGRSLQGSGTGTQVDLPWGNQPFWDTTGISLDL
jgi:hypothetical protein